MDLVEALATPPSAPIVARNTPAVPKAGEPGSFVWDGNKGTINSKITAENVTTWDEFIIDAGLDPAEVEVIEPVRTRGWDAAVGNGETAKMHWYSLEVRRKRPGLNIDELVNITKKAKPAKKLPEGDSTFVVAIGDLQLGKMDGDGVEGTVGRAIDGLYEAAERLKLIRKHKSVGPVHIAWLGDCIEGFVSQGGANAWRTTLTVTEQIRLLRRIMLKSVEIFAPLSEQLTCAAVPGNHDQAIRFGKNGVTRYDDSFDIDALLAVSEACQISDAYKNVKFYVPEKDEMAVTLEVSGTKLGHIHGHQTRVRQHFTWWAKQSLGDQQIGQADVLLAGHFHHFVLDTFGKRKFIQVPALESESTWYRHNNGETGDPGILTFVTKDGSINNIEIV